MLKKIVIAIAVMAATSSIAVADVTPYLGVELGGDWGTINLKDLANVNHNYTTHGALGGLFLGLGGDVSTYFHLGAELFADESTDITGSKTINTPNGPSTAKVSAHYTWGGSILPGFQFAPNAMVFLRAGVVRTRFILSQPVPPSTATSTSSSNMQTGSEIGIGLQGCITKEWMVRGEYDYISYRSFTSFGNQISARNNMIKVGLAYNLS